MAILSTSTAVSAEIEIVNPASLYNPAPNGYSHVVVAENVGKVVYVAGQGGETADGTLSSDFEAQVEQAYKNLASALDAVGAKPSDVLKLNTYVVDHEQEKLGILTRQLLNMFGDHLPAQTLVPVPRLALDGMLFEVDATVVLDKQD